MSISSAQMMQQVLSEERPADLRHSTPTPPSSAPAVISAAESDPKSSASKPDASSPGPVRTDLRIDEQHQFYYEFVDDSTGNVEFEIPPEALRAIGETLNVPLLGDSSASAIDVKS